VIANKRTDTLLPILVIATVYALLGIAGLTLALPLNYATLVFPSSGVASVAVLYFGVRILPGIWIGSFIVNLCVSINHTHSINLDAFFIAMSIGIGACIQAWASYYLVNQIGRVNWRQLTSAIDIFLFLFLSGPIACFISASWANMTLLLFNRIPNVEFMTHWVNWWLGDVIGVILFAPLFLGVLLRREPLWKTRQKTIVIPILVMTMVIVCMVIQFLYGNRIPDDYRLLIEEMLFLSIILIGLFQGVLLVITGIYNNASIKLEQQNIELKKSEERWRFALEGSGDAVWEYSCKTGKYTVSRRMLELLGLSVKDQDSKEFQFNNWRERLHPEDSSQTILAFQAIQENKSTPYIIEHRLRCKDGSYKWFLTRGIVVNCDSHDKPIRMLGTSADITRIKTIEYDLQRVAHEAKKMLSEQHQFMAMLNHEVKTPLSVIKMTVGIKDMSPNRILRVQQAVNDLEAIIDRCLQVDQFEQKLFVPKLETCQINDLIHEQMDLISIPSRVSIQLANLPEVQTDTQLLQIAINNMISNALKYSDPHSLIKLSTQVNEYSILISISNKAGFFGVPDLDYVFKKYYRHPKSHSVSGTGLGLYLIKNIAEILDGKVSYFYEKNIVRFDLCIPL